MDYEDNERYELSGVQVRFVDSFEVPNRELLQVQVTYLLKIKVIHSLYLGGFRFANDIISSGRD